MTEITRCPWCLSDSLYIQYHDTEWGKPCYDDRRLFAMLCLESMQAGLSWMTILKKRQAYYCAFDDFNPHKIVNYDNNEVNELMNNAGIIRHQKKILAIINNAKAYLAITSKQSFSHYLWQTAIGSTTPLINYPRFLHDIPTQTEHSIKLAKQLKQDGFYFIGPTLCYAFMQACGMVDDHLVACQFKTPINAQNNTVGTLT